MIARVSIVVLNYNTRALLGACLRSIEQFAPDAETIVVDNASADGSVEMVRVQFPRFELMVSPANVGFARALNWGLRRATGTAILALNADTELCPNTLPGLVALLEQLPRAGILGPCQFADDPDDATSPMIASGFGDPTLSAETARLLFFRDSIAARLRIGAWQKPRTPKRVDWLMGAALLFRRACLDAIKGFDETQFMYGEDWDIGYRARQAGWEIYLVPAAPIIHRENASGQSVFGSSRQAQVLRANLYFHEKHFGRASRRVLALLHLIGAGLRLPLFSFSRARWLAQIEQARAAWQGLQ